MLDEALAQLSGAHRCGTPILIRADTAGGTYGFLAHIRSLRQQEMHTCFSAGLPITEPIRAAITATADEVWCPALDFDGDVRDGAQIAEITGLVNPQLLANYPPGTRVIVRRERPHPGAHTVHALPPDHPEDPREPRPRPRQPAHHHTHRRSYRHQPMISGRIRPPGSTHE